MNATLNALSGGRWSLTRSRELAREIEGKRRWVRTLVCMMFEEDPELRKRASDVARRVTERSAELLHPYADELAGLLASLPVEESRTRWHLGLVVARVAHTREQRLRVARLMSLLAEDASNAARCSGVEGMALLALGEPSLREEAEELIERALRQGTPAMKCRARDAKKTLAKKCKGN